MMMKDTPSTTLLLVGGALGLLYYFLFHCKPDRHNASPEELRRKRLEKLQRQDPSSNEPTRKLPPFSSAVKSSSSSPRKVAKTENSAVKSKKDSVAAAANKKKDTAEIKKELRYPESSKTKSSPQKESLLLRKVSNPKNFGKALTSKKDLVAATEKEDTIKKELLAKNSPVQETKTPSPPDSSKKSLPKKQKDPIRLLGERLAVAWHVPVQILRDGKIFGEHYAGNRKDGIMSVKLDLALSPEANWQQVVTAIQKLQETVFFKFLQVTQGRAPTLSALVLWYTNLTPDTTKKDGKDLSVCLKLFQTWMARSIAQKLNETVHNIVEDEDDVPGLFADELVEPSQTPAEGMAGEFLQLLQQGDRALLSSDLLVVLPIQPETCEQMLLQLLQNLSKATTSTAGNPVVHLSALSSWVSHSPPVQQFFAKWLESSVESLDGAPQLPTGREWQESLQSTWAPLLTLAAYTIPETNASLNPIIVGSIPGLWTRQLHEFDADFALAVFLNDRQNQLQSTLDQGRHLMKFSRNVSGSCLQWALKHMDKRVLFDWIRTTVKSNESLTEMLHAELLSPDGIAALASSWTFLVGLASTLLGMSGHSLLQKFEKQGSSAFDIRYLLLGKDGLEDSSVPSIAGSLRGDEKEKKQGLVCKRFDGATEFFFLISALLRCSLYPMLRVESAYMRQINKLLMFLQGAERNNDPLPPHLKQQAPSAVANWMGWKACLEDPDFCSTATGFALVQLQWIQEMLRKDPGLVNRIPDFFVKEPCRWLANVARTSQRSLTAFQGDRVVAVTTELLMTGSQNSDGASRGDHSFSPLVLAELIHVASAFVNAGVNRARQVETYRERRRGLRMKNAQPIKQDSVDEDDLDIYLSFDHNDLGVAVFANQLVCKQLCPTLLRTFRALDHIEGLDVDREQFDKYTVKVEISQLLLRLWGHPNGECQQSIVQLPPVEIARFVSSVAAALGTFLEDGCHRFSDYCKSHKRPQRLLSPRDKQFADRQASAAVSGFSAARKLLSMLWRFSQDERFAAAIGSSTLAAKDMAAMIINFLDVLTSLGGMTHPDLDMLSLERGSSADLFEREPSMGNAERAELASRLVEARIDTRMNVGLDVSVLCHQLLALAARWHEASCSQSGKGCLLLAMAKQEDCNVARYHSVVETLIAIPDEVPPGMSPARAVFKHDGYVGPTIWACEEKQQRDHDMKEDQRYWAKQSQISHAALEAVVSQGVILEFLGELKTACEHQKASLKVTAPDDVEKTQELIMEGPSDLTEDAYGEILGEWIVSSESFLSPNNDGSFLHVFGKTAQSHGNVGSGKTLVKEARKCHKGIPVPHPNSAIFVCFAEERMDLCRALVTGPVDTPYAYGLFVFDVYFPPGYPHIPPLVQFMTTGGGQVRFGPNLYRDGKVCLSLLGTFHAGDKSQQWNPSVSSLAQIMLSIQTQLLTAEPYYNEPGTEAVRGTPSGREASERYNLQRRLDTLRHAIVEPLVHAPIGFEEVVQRHFLACRKRVLTLARRWTVEANGTPLEGRFDRVYRQLLALLHDLPTEDEACLPPVKEDILYLQRHDDSWNIEEDNRKPAAVSVESSSNVTLAQDFMSNPWANPAAAAILILANTNKNDSSEDSDEDDLYS